MTGRMPRPLLASLALLAALIAFPGPTADPQPRSRLA